MEKPSKEKFQFENIVVLLTGIAGVGKRTIGEAMSSLNHAFRCVPDDSWLDPVLHLLGDDAATMNTLTSEGWAAINKVRNAIFDTIAHVCPRESNFIITHELLEGNVWHKSFYERLELMANEKKAKLIPIRLICDVPTLLKRVISEDRKKFFKTRDAKMIKERALATEAFKSNNNNELTLDTTHLPPQESAKKIFQHLSHIV